MDVLPSEYQQLELSREEKIFARNVASCNAFGYLLLNVNPAMQPNVKMHVLISSEGILFFHFFDEFEDASQFPMIMPFIKGLCKQEEDIIIKKLKTNKVLVDARGCLRFSTNIICVFPAFEEAAAVANGNDSVKKFATQKCIFKNELSRVRRDLCNIISKYLSFPVSPCASEIMEITERNVNAILQRITPEYVTIRVAPISDKKTKAGANEELLIITEDDVAVKAFRLDREQINIVNKISKGEQLILACAGSGKSVLLIAKCFKAAEMNPDKQFLLTCYNNNLNSLYTWFIDRAGLRAKNVTCLTFHTLCKKLLNDNGFATRNSDFDGWVRDAISRLNAGQIEERFYGIFIDEVQEFDTEWYKFCFNLLENKDSKDHLFVICGDKTQKLKSQQKHGKAPWNAGEGYPNYRGGNKNIRIERNYRNCIEINEYINRYVSYAKSYLNIIQKDAEWDPDMFLRGQSVFHGNDVIIKRLVEKSNTCEANTVYTSIKYIHDNMEIPYDEIAVIMYNGSYRKNFLEWSERTYNLENSLDSLLRRKDIPFCKMYSSGSDWGTHYGDDGGVRFIKFESTLGLDFRAAIVCGLLPLGEYQETKVVDWTSVKEDQEVYQTKLQDTQDCIRRLYVACTRAKEILHIILPESGTESVYVKLLEDAGNYGE